MNIKELTPRLASNGVSFYEFDIFKNQPVNALFTTRNGGVSTGCYSSLNFGFSSGDDVNLVMRNYELLAECLSCTTGDLITAAQTHTNNIKIVTRKDAGMGVTKPRDFQDIDGLVTNVTGIGLVTAHADCTPVQFFDPVKKVVAVAHSGWSGTLKNISGRMIQTMVKTYDCNPQDILAAIGPALCQDCFEVDEDVAQKFLAANSSYETFMYRKGMKSYFDLRKIIELQLLDEGVVSSHIVCNPICTKCHEELFYSHRRMGVNRGVMASAILLK